VVHPESISELLHCDTAGRPGFDHRVDLMIIQLARQSHAGTVANHL
jgi:hypothetical protein